MVDDPNNPKLGVRQHNAAFGNQPATNIIVPNAVGDVITSFDGITWESGSGSGAVLGPILTGLSLMGTDTGIVVQDGDASFVKRTLTTDGSVTIANPGGVAGDIGLSVQYANIPGTPTMPVTISKVASQWVDSYDEATGLFTQSQPTYSDIKGTPTLPTSITKVASQWVDSYDSVTGLFTQSQPAYSDLTGTPQLPITKGAVASNWLNSYNSGTGLFTATQPAFTDISGTATAGQLPVTVAYTNNANNWSVAQQPNVAGTIDIGTTALPFRNLIFGGAATNNTKLASAVTTAQRTCTFPDANSNPVQPITKVASKWLDACSSAGLFTATQPAFSDISGTATSGQLPATVAYTNSGNSWSVAQVPNAAGTIDLGSTTLPFRDLYLRGAGTNYARFLTVSLNGNRTVNIPNANTTTCQADAGTASQWFRALDGTTGAFTKSQPAFTDISGTLAGAQLPSTVTQFGGDGSRTLPTSGAISGIYMHSGNWTSTGALTAQPGTKIYVTGSFTLNHAITFTGQVGGGGGGTSSARIGGCGYGPGRGESPSSSAISRNGGNGGTSIGRGGTGGGPNETRGNAGAPNSLTASWIVGSSGSGGNYNSTDAVTGGAGGTAGGDLYIEVLGAVTIGANITATGGAGANGAGTAANRGGSGGGGSGGCVEIRTRSTYTQNIGAAIDVSGGAGGTGGTTRGGGGGGGGGGFINILAGGAYTQNGTTPVAGGAAGTSGEANAAAAGTAGVAVGTGSLTSVPPRTF